MTGRRVTPTAAQLLPADAPEHTWLNTRQTIIGSSDIPAILGVDTHKTALHIWHEKRGTLPPDDDLSEPALWGKALEHPVAAEWCRRNRSVIRRVGLVANIDRPWAGCTLDRRVVECPQGESPCALEVKCRTAFLASRWRRGVPDDVLAQVLWQMQVTGYRHIHVAVLIGGNDYRQYVIRIDDHLDVMADVAAAAAVFHEHVQRGTTPTVLTSAADGDPLLDLYQRLHPDRAGTVEVDRDMATLDAAYAAVREYETARLAARAADKAKKAARAALVGLLDGGDTATIEGRLAFEYVHSYDRESVDMDRLRTEHPAVYEACRRSTPVYRIGIARELRHDAADVIGDDQ